MKELNMATNPISIGKSREGLGISNDSTMNLTTENNKTITHQTNTGVLPSGEDTSGISNVYTIGQIGYDFGTETNKAIWEQRLNGKATNPEVMATFLKQNPHDAIELFWTLNQDTVPIYGITPLGSFGGPTYNRIIQLFTEQLSGQIERVAIAGIMGRGRVRLLNRQKIPKLAVTTPRNIVGLNTADLTKAAIGARANTTVKANFENFLQRIYHELRNMGVSDADRALNYAATNAYQAGSVFTQAFKEGMSLSTVSSNSSPIARPGTITYDVNMTFFDPSRRFEKAKKVYRFMVDVSHVTPVSVGQIRSWSVY